MGHCSSPGMSPGGGMYAGLASEIVTLAFGLGGREEAARVIANWRSKS
jgi:hypothetical protein